MNLFINRFLTYVPLTDKPGSWFLLAKCLKNTCGRWPASLLKMSLFHRCFSNILLVRTNYLVYTLLKHWSKLGWYFLTNDFLFSNPIEHPILQKGFSCPALLLHIFDTCSSKLSLLSTSTASNVTFSEEFMTFSSIVSFWGLFFLVLPVNYCCLKFFLNNHCWVISTPLCCNVSFFFWFWN